MEYLAKKLGVSKAAEAVGASKRIFYRMPRCESLIYGASLEKILSANSLGEALEVLGARKRLETCEAIEGGRVGGGVVLEILMLVEGGALYRAFEGGAQVRARV